MAPFPDPLRGGPQLHLWRTREWLVDADITGPLVVLVHGLASSSLSFTTLATHLSKTFPVAVFDYVSHEGINRGAADLESRLRRFSDRLEQTGMALIGHSMGGLVAKYFARHSHKFRKALRGLSTLGTPHGGMQSKDRAARQRWLAMMLDILERQGDLPNPYARSLFCPAARQLLGSDPQQVVSTLLDGDRRTPLDIPVLTFSGGQPYLEYFESGTRRNEVANRFLQVNLSKPNDGLVEEWSANLAGLLDVVPPHYRHCNDYVGWSTTNHTYLLQNQDIGETLVEWLESAFSRKVSS